MKRIFLLFIVIMQVSADNVQAQASGLYIKAGGGLGVALAGQTLDNNNIPFYGNITYLPNNPTTVDAFDVKKASFSSGVQALAAVGYMFSENIGVEIVVNGVLASSKYDVYEYNAINPAGTDIGTNHLTRQVSFPLFITPSLVYTSGSTDIDGNLKKFTAYARGGIVLPVITKMVEEQQYNYTTTGEDEYIREETKMKFGVGFSGAMGIRYNASPNLSVWLECNMMALSLYAKQTTVTDHTLDENPSTRNPVAGTVIKYTNTGSYTAYQQEPVYSVPFSNLGVAVGVMVFLKSPPPKESTRK